MNKWEQVMVARTCDGSGMHVRLEAMNHDNQDRQYRIVYGEENAQPEELFCFEGFLTLGAAFLCFTDYVKGEVCGYFGLDDIADAPFNQ